MKRIVFCEIPMKKMSETDRFCYKDKGNVSCKYDGKVIFGINAYLYDKVEENEEIKFVLCRAVTGVELKDKISEENVQVFKNEVAEVFGNKINPEYVLINTDYRDSDKAVESRFKAMAKTLENDAVMYADITFGFRPFAIIIFNLLRFGSLFFKSKVKTILYSKVLFDENNKPFNPEIIDVTTFYHLNNLTDAMCAKDGEQALNLLDEYFAM